MQGNLRVALGLMFALAVLGGGCVASGPEVDGELGEPLGTITFTEQDPDQGILRGTYDYDGYVISFEAIRGERNPMWDLTGPRFATDARLCDDQEFCFALQGGGHGIASEDWAGTIPDSQDERHAYGNHAAAWALHQDLRLLDRSEFLGLEEQLDALDGLTNVPDPGALPDTSMNQETETPDMGVSSYALSSGWNYNHYFQIFWKPTSSVPGTEHSSTRSISVDASGWWRQWVSTCNHGTCAATSGIYWLCGRAFSGRPLALPVSLSSRCGTTASSGVFHPSGETNCCTTTYGIRGGQHTCNDDSRLQRETMAYLGPPWASYCYDSSLAAWAPGCW